MFRLFTENSLILHKQSGFKPGDSCATQLLSITHEIFRLHCTKNEPLRFEPFSRCYQIRRKLADFVTFTEEILNGKLHFLWSVTARTIVQETF